MGSPNFISQNGSLRSNQTSANSLFSLGQKNYSNLLLNKSNYYYQNDEIGDEQDELIPLPETLLGDLSIDSFSGFSEVQRINSGSPLSFDTPRDKRRRSIVREPTGSRRSKFIFILVGLPAVGKSTISAQLIRFIQSNPATHSLRCLVYNAGKVRRKMSFKNLGKLSMELANNSSDDLFNPKNSEKKEKYARITLDKLLKELDMDICDVGIFDATNSRVQRRQFVFEEICAYNENPESNFRVTPMVLQITCDDPNFIRYNVHQKSFNEDYFDKPYEYAVRDFARRLKNYYSQFTPFSCEEFDSLVKLINDRGLGHGLFVYNIVNTGLVPSKHLNNNHFPSNFSREIVQMVNLMESFVEHYTRMFGYTYIERVKEFFNDEMKNVEAKSTPGGLNYLSTLGSILDEEYFGELQELLRRNLENINADL
ncbi:hypothetical protein HG537_0E02550 [Torulaspora globosa]|uniref:6-phosphofructo-2-kinase domain-containing protein n=1 Tax=Torulaspora globosa TaxID=48254 RepID=A0A7H9HU76_9SACH|nr:hypothetical protein HG537_0E02550 [Torulaspora sp. CBS 2947]